MDRSRLYGFIILPVAALTFGLLGLGFWIGWTIVMLKTEAPPDDK
jgi:hypothetical protein